MDYRAKLVGLLLSSLIMFQNTQTIYSQRITKSNPNHFSSKILFNLSQQNVLELGKLLEERELKGGESHTYTIELKAGEFSKIVVEQKGIDIVLSLFAPTGELLREVDSPNGTEGEEILSSIAKVSGTYKVEIKSLDKSVQSGKYNVKVGELRTASARDAELIKVEELDEKIELSILDGKIDEAIFLAEQSLAAKEKIWGSKHAYTAVSLNKLGELHFSKAQYEKAQIFLEKAFEIRKSILDKEDLDLAESANNLAVFSATVGNYERSEVLYKEALGIYERKLGLENPVVLFVTGNLASTYDAKGDYAKSELFYQKILKVKKKLFGENDISVANTQNSLALVYSNKGEYEEAENLYKNSIVIQEKLLGDKHKDTVASYNNLALLYTFSGEHNKAEAIYLKIFTNLKEVLGEESIQTASVISNLASLYSKNGDYEKAEPLFIKSLEIRKKMLGENHPDVAVSLDQYGLLCYRKGEYKKAEDLFIRGLEIRENSLGLSHDRTSGSLTNLAILYQAQGDINKAIEYTARAIEVRDRDLENNLLLGSEAQKLKYLALRESDKNQSLSLHIKFAPTNESAANLALTEILRRKGRVLDVMANTLAKLRSQSNQEDKKLFDMLLEKRTEFSLLKLRSPFEQTKTEGYLIKIKRLEDEIESLQKELINKSTEFKTLATQITLKSVQESIPNDVVLLEFVTYKPFYPKTRTYGTPEYVVYLLSNQGSPRFVSLGSVESVDKAVSDFRKVLIKSPQKNINSLNKDLKQKARKMDKLVMEPVRKLLRGEKHLLIAPDGALNIIPFDALVDEKGKYLIENYEISYLTSGRDLIRLQTKSVSKEAMVVFADPDFGEGKGPNLANKQYKPLSNLKATLQEALQIKNLFPVSQVYVGRNATKEKIRLVKHPEILHIATHGLFLSNNEEKSNNESSKEKQRILKIGRKKSIKPIDETAQESTTLTNPLLKSCLFFAGANQTELLESQRVGIMTALEASSLDLFGTKLVVLSACESGLGEIQTGEGVYGLRRAFLLAGSETQMISLWSVDDNATKDLMVNYYKALKKEGKSRSQALRSVQLSFLQKNIKPTKGQKKQLDLSHPYYWASFIQSGEWGTLDGKR